MHKLPIRCKCVGTPPTRATEQASGFDLRTAEPTYFDPFETQVVYTNLRIQLPPGYEAQVRPRSGVSAKGWLVHLGTIDADYRGVIGIIVTNLCEMHREIGEGQRIAQLVFSHVPSIEFERVESLEPSGRGECGFGSTGK